MRKKSSGISKGLIRPGTGGPPEATLAATRINKIHVGITMSESHNAVHSIENHWMINHTVIVKFAEILYFRDAALVELEVILLKTQNNVFENVIDYGGDKILMIPIQS